MTDTADADGSIDGAAVPWPTISLPANGRLVVGRSGRCDVVMGHVTASRKHAKLEHIRNVVEIEDLQSRFGTFVNGNRIVKSRLIVGDLVRFGSSPPYRFDGQHLRIDHESSGMALRLLGVSVIRGHRTLLADVNIAIPAGQFVGLLGSSGAGKSTLLGCLAGTTTPSSGSITFDGKYPVADHLGFFRSRVGNVPQDDLIYPSLTVEENLRFAAQLRCPELNRGARQTSVSQVMSDMGLDRIAASRASVISGGERKRLSVGIELLTKPRLLLLDEPTSGLDPGRHARLMDLLRGLTRQGITVVCSTHTLDTLHFFDRVILVGRRDDIGTIAYDGAPNGLLASFGARNSAELYERLEQASDQCNEKEEGTRPSTDTSVENTSAPSAAQLFESPSPAGEPVITPRRFLGQVGLVVRRTWCSFRRDRGNLLLWLIQPAALGLLVLFSQQDQHDSVFIHFFMAVCMLWLGMTLTVRELVRDRRLYVRDRLAGLKPNAALAGKIVITALLLSVQAVVMWSVARVLIEPLITPDGSAARQLTEASLSWSILIGWLVGVGGAFVGLIVSALSASERAAVALLPLAVLPQVFLSRVAYGHGGEGWQVSSPFGPIATFFERGSDDAGGGWPREMIRCVSLPILTRPATAALDLPKNWTNPSTRWLTTAAECMYLIALIIAYGMTLMWCFGRRESTWTLERETS